MLKFYKKQSGLIFILIICMVTCSARILATDSKTVENDISNYYKSIKNLQKQLESSLESSYTNIIEGKSNSEVVKQVKVYIEQINKLNSDLVDYQVHKQTTKEQLSKIQTLILADNYLKYGAEKIQEYAVANTPGDQFKNLKLIIQSNTLLDQLLNYI